MKGITPKLSKLFGCVNSIYPIPQIVQIVWLGNSIYPQSNMTKYLIWINYKEICLHLKKKIAYLRLYPLSIIVVCLGKIILLSFSILLWNIQT